MTTHLEASVVADNRRKLFKRFRTGRTFTAAQAAEVLGESSPEGAIRAANLPPDWLIDDDLPNAYDVDLGLPHLHDVHLCVYRADGMTYYLFAVWA